MTQQANKMSSASPLPPPTPPAQKPTRIIKARPPMRPRPYLPPRPASDKLTPANHATTAAPDVSRKVPEPLHKPEDISTRVTVSEEAVPPEPSIAKHPVITLEPVTPPEPATTAEPAKEHLNALKHTGNVKKIVGQFDHGVVQQDKEPTHPPPLPEKKLPPQPVKPARITRRPSDVAAPLPKNKAVNLALNCTENGIEGLAIQSHDAGDTMKDNPFEQVGGGQLELREDQPDSRQSEHTEGQHVNMQNVPVCRRDCPCSCHAKRPGMVMVWVPESKVKSLCVEEEVATFSDSSSSADDSPPFHQVFVVNHEPTEGTKHSSAEDVNGNLSGEIANSKNSRTSKTSMALLSKKPFSGSYPVRRQSLTNATGTTNCMKNPGLTNGHHDGKTQEDSSGSSVVLTSYRSMPDSSFSDDEAFMPITDCKGGSTTSTPVSETLPEPPCEAAPATASVLKPPRKSKLGSQTSMENEAPQPPIPPKAPRKPPRTSLAPLPFFRKGSLKKQSGKDILEEESPVTDGPLHRRRAAKADRGRPFSSSKEQKEDLGDSSFEEISTEDCETHSSDQTGKNSDGAPVSGGPSVTSPKSIDWESRLQDEPLYQTYRQAVIRKEIKRQTVPRNSSITSFDVNSECSPTSSEYGGNSPRSRRSITPQNTLWQELPAVRESGILEQMSQEERKMQESMFEVLTSEASYLRSLSVLTEHFMESRELDDTIIIREKKILFSNILKVKEVSERFLKDLEERVDESLYITDICDIIYSHAQQNFLVYIDYVRNQVYQEKTYSSLMERNVQFATVITRLQELPQCQRLPFMSFLLLPFQRITRIKMLIENILKRSKEGSTREQNALKAFASVSKIIEECNSEVGRMKQMEELIHITKKIEFDKIKAVPIISQARYLEKQGELSEVIQKGSLFGIKPKFTPVYFFLFNDFLLITHRKSSERHVVVDYAHRSLVQVQGCADYPHGATTMENGFFLTLLENHQGKTCDRLFKAPTQSDMHRWMGAFPNKKEQTHASDETIYEDWDCPQVQCVESYIATQADELDLEPTDIINILRKTTEGWCEGIRLSDGLKGWFPSKYVQEITNEHVRRRNLRERYRVLQAARQIQITKTSDPKKKYYST